MKTLFFISALVLLISGCASNPSGDNSPEFKKIVHINHGEYLYKQEPFSGIASYILTVSRKGWRCGMGILEANTGWCDSYKAKQGALKVVASKICQQENRGDYVVFTNSQITSYKDAKFKCFDDENEIQAWNVLQEKIKEDREKKRLKAARLAYQQKIERQWAAREAAILEVIARENAILAKKNAILESKKEKCRSDFKENTDGFGLCMLEQDRIAIQAKREAEESIRREIQKDYEQRKREAQALINAGAAILNRNKGNCNFSCPGGQVVQGSCSTSSINVNGKICFKR